jgi:hypothetical protein
MIDGVLSRLNSDQMLGVASTISGSAALRHYFASCDEVQDVAFALQRGVITEEGVKRFVEDLLDDLKKWVLFSHDLTLAALAVALETRYTLFADEFLHWLSQMQSAEMPIGPQVANEVLYHRAWPPAQKWVGLPRKPTEPNVAVGLPEMSERFYTRASQQHTELCK